MRNKLIYCIPLALSITCLIGCAAKAAQMPAEPEPVALLPEQKQSSIVTNDAKNETIPPPQQSEHEDTSDNIADMVRPFGCCRPVLQAVANLYLRRQIIFERLS